MVVNLVCFHVAYTKEVADQLSTSQVRSKQKIAHYLNTLDQQLNPVDLIHSLYESAIHFNPHIQLMVISNQTTSFEGLDDRIEVIRYDFPNDNIMLCRLWAQCKFLEESQCHGPILFTDTDMIFQCNLATIFENSTFDIALTERSSDVMPINGGLIFVSHRRIEQVRHFFRSLEKIFKEQFGDQSLWWGDQLALKALLDQSTVVGPSKREYAGIEIELFACEEYNFSPRGLDYFYKISSSQRKILHFKDYRKFLMASYCHYLLKKTVASFFVFYFHLLYHFLLRSLRGRVRERLERLRIL